MVMASSHGDESEGAKGTETLNFDARKMNIEAGWKRLTTEHCGVHVGHLRNLLCLCCRVSDLGNVTCRSSRPRMRERSK